jgi:hypothetical protein
MDLRSGSPAVLALNTMQPEAVVHDDVIGGRFGHGDRHILPHRRERRDGSRGCYVALPLCGSHMAMLLVESDIRHYEHELEQLRHLNCTKQPRQVVKAAEIRNLSQDKGDNRRLKRHHRVKLSADARIRRHHLVEENGSNTIDITRLIPILRQRVVVNDQE